MLQLIKALSTSSNDPQKIFVMLSASVYFKRVIKMNWEDEENNRIPNDQRVAIKTHLVDFMCAVPNKIQMQFSEAIGIISKTDFPNQWKDLLPKLVSRINTNDLVTTNAVLKTANAIFKRFVNASKDDINLYPLKISLEQFQEPMLKLFQTLCQMLMKLNPNDRSLTKTVEQLYTGITLLVKIFYSLNWLDLPEFFEDHMKEYFGMFHNFLNYNHPIIEADADEFAPSLGDKLKKNIVKCLNLYVFSLFLRDTIHTHTQTHTDTLESMKRSSCRSFRNSLKTCGIN